MPLLPIILCALGFTAGCMAANKNKSASDKCRISDRKKIYSTLKLFAKYLPFLRRVKNMSQDQLASGLGVSRQTINGIENGRTDLSIPMAIALMAIFDELAKDDPLLDGIFESIATLADLIYEDL